MSQLTYLQQVVRGLVKTTSEVERRVIAPVAMILWIIIDQSGSMAEACGRDTRLGAAQRAATKLLAKLWASGIFPQVGVMAFDEDATVVLDPTPSDGNEDRIRGAIQSITIAGGTDLAAPLHAVDRAFVPGMRIEVVQVTDGRGGNPISIATSLKSRGVIIQTVGVAGHRVDVDEAVLRKVASVVDGKVLYRFVDDPDDLDNYFDGEIGGRLTKPS